MEHSVKIEEEEPIEHFWTDGKGVMWRRSRRIADGGVQICRYERRDGFYLWSRKAPRRPIQWFANMNQEGEAWKHCGIELNGAIQHQRFQDGRYEGDDFCVDMNEISFDEVERYVRGNRPLKDPDDLTKLYRFNTLLILSDKKSVID